MRDLDKLLQFLRQEQVEPVKATLDDLRQFSVHERQLVAHLVDAGVVALIETDEKGGIALHGNTV